MIYSVIAVRYAFLPFVENLKIGHNFEKKYTIKTKTNYMYRKIYKVGF